MAVVFTNAASFCSSVLLSSQKCSAKGFSVDGYYSAVYVQFGTIPQCTYTSTPSTSTFRFQQQDNTKHTTVCLMSVHILQQVFHHIFHHRSTLPASVVPCTLLQYCLYTVGFQTSILYSIVFYANNCRVSSHHSYIVSSYQSICSVSNHSAKVYLSMVN